MPAPNVEDSRGVGPPVRAIVGFYLFVTVAACGEQPEKQRTQVIPQELAIKNTQVLAEVGALVHLCTNSLGFQELEAEEALSFYDLQLRLNDLVGFMSTKSDEELLVLGYELSLREIAKQPDIIEMSFGKYNTCSDKLRIEVADYLMEQESIFTEHGFEPEEQLR